MSERIEVGDVFRYPNIMADLTAQEVNLSSVKADGVWHAIEFCTLVRKAAAKDSYEGLTLPEPPPGYRLARWEETMSDPELKIKYWVNSQWTVWRLGCLTVGSFSLPRTSIFAVPVDSPITPQLQPDCKWVKKGWALHPTDFKMEDGKNVTAEYAGRSWDVLTEEEAAKHEWQRPRELDVEILHTQKRIKTAAYKLGESEGQKFIWEMLQATAKAAKVLGEIRDRAEAAAKALQGGAE